MKGSLAHQCTEPPPPHHLTPSENKERGPPNPHVDGNNDIMHLKQTMHSNNDCVLERIIFDWINVFSLWTQSFSIFVVYIQTRTWHWFSFVYIYIFFFLSPAYFNPNQPPNRMSSLEMSEWICTAQCQRQNRLDLISSLWSVLTDPCEMAPRFYCQSCHSHWKCDMV